MFEVAFEERGKCLDSTCGDGMPLFDPGLDGAAVERIVFDDHAGEGLAPFAMPLAVFVEGIEDLAEQMVAFAERQLAEVGHKEFVEQRLEDEVQGDERFRPVVTDEQFFNCEA